MDTFIKNNSNIEIKHITSLDSKEDSSLSKLEQVFKTQSYVGQFDISIKQALMANGIGPIGYSKLHFTLEMGEAIQLCNSLLEFVQYYDDYYGTERMEMIKFLLDK